jgi:hypothetical protein
MLPDHVLDLLQHVQHHRGDDDNACDFHESFPATTAGLAYVQIGRRTLLHRVRQLKFS